MKRVERVYLSYQFYNFFLTPVHDWLHDCIQDWTRKLDPALMTSVVWPNLCQGIIAMWSGGKVGQFCEPSRARTKVESLEWRLKAVLPFFRLFPYFGGFQLNPLPVFDDLTVFCQRGTKNTGYACIISPTGYSNDLVVAYLTTPRCWLQWRRERGYVNWYG